MGWSLDLLACLVMLPEASEYAVLILMPHFLPQGYPQGGGRNPCSVEGRVQCTWRPLGSGSPLGPNPEADSKPLLANPEQPRAEGPTTGS